MTLSEKTNGLYPLILGLFLLLNAPLMGDYLWPLPASHELTAHFCDYRGGHYHAGIDIRTFGKTGYNVVAVEDGYLMRVGSNWWGYGNVVYLKLSDGNIAVYGHLSEFTPEVEKYVRQNQKEARSFKVNLFPQENQFRFKKGDLIGKSGQSGSGAPHLHFEIRDSENRPINPLPFYGSLKDGRAPRFEEITFRPLDANSFVEGKARPYSVKFSYSKEKNNYYFTEIPAMHGKIGVEIKAADRRSGTDRKYNFSGLEFFIKDELVFETRYDTLSFDSWGQLDLDYNIYQRIDDKDFYHNLYYPDGQKSPAQNPHTACGSCRAYPIDRNSAPGIYDARVYTHDKNGNRREAEFKFRILPVIMPDSEVTALYSSDSARKEYFRCSDNSGFSAQVSMFKPDSGKFIFTGNLKSTEDARGIFKIDRAEICNIAIRSPNDYTLLRIDFNSEGISLGSYLMGINNGRHGQFIDSIIAGKVNFINKVDFVSSEPVVEIDPVALYDFLTVNQFGAAFFQPIEKGSKIRFPLILREALKEYAYDDENLPILSYLTLEKLKTQNYCLYKTGSQSEFTSNGMMVKIEKSLPFDMFFKFETSDNSDEINGIRLIPDDHLITDGIEIYAKLPNSYPADKIAVYGISRDGKPGFIGAERVEGGYLKAVINSLGTYRLMADTVAPEIRNISPANNARISNSRPNISFYMDDELSGFDSDTLLLVTIDGAYQICEYDIDNEIVYVRLTESLRPGNHELIIKARDCMGNTTTKKSSFTYTTASKK